MIDRDLAHELLDWIRSHHFGKYRGVVVDNDDSTGRGRLKVRVPSLLGSLEVWAMPCVPYAGDGVGFYSLPPEESGVWVEFEGGDPSYPIWTGCFWADDELPDGDGPDVKIWKTDKITVRLDDANDELRMETGSGATVTLTDEVTAESGQATHTVAGSGIVSELGAGKVEVTSASVSVNSGAFEVM